VKLKTIVLLSGILVALLYYLKREPLSACLSLKTEDNAPTAEEMQDMNERMKILIAYDGSDCANAALDDLRKAGLPSNSEAFILSVAEVWLPPPTPSSYEIVEAASEVKSPADLQKEYLKGSREVSEALSLAMRAKERLQNNFPGWQIAVEVTYGSPAWELIMKADQWRPDLTVVGSHGRNALGRLVMGSVSQKVLTEARSSVRVARGRVEVEDSPVRIIIGVDGSPGSEAAVKTVAARQWPVGSEVRVIIVEDPLVLTLIGHLIPNVAKWVEENNQGEIEWTQKLAEHATAQLRAAELNVSSIVLSGDPKRVLVEEADKWGADSIFVGSVGFSNRFERFMLGSVSAAVAARAHCSVEVVRAEQRES
jgi:nucleotide-binding universal stress UspA family protein